MSDSVGVVTAVVFLFAIVIFVYGWWSRSRPIHVPPPPVTPTPPQEIQYLEQQVEGLEKRVTRNEADIQEMEIRVGAITRS